MTHADDCIRQAQAGDAAAISVIIKAAFGDDVDADKLAKKLSATRLTFVTTRDDDVTGFVDGFVTVAADGTQRYELDLLAVRPDVQGRGAGRLLVETFTQAAFETGVDMIRVVVAADNAPMQRLMARFGYVLQPATYALHIIQGQHNAHADASLAQSDGAYLLPVSTLTYDGIWLEGKLTSQAVTAAQQLTAGTIGAMVDVNRHDTAQWLQSSGFEVVGRYQFWMLASG